MSFFGGGKKEEVKEQVTPIYKTGKFVDGLILTLITNLYDRKDNVREVHIKSIKDIGDQHPELTLSTAANFLQTDSKAGDSHRILLLQIMKTIAEEQREKISKGLSLHLVNLAFNEMTASKDVKPEWQTAAANLLVTLGGTYGKEVLEYLVKRVEPGVMPHYFVVKTLGDLAVANPLAVVPTLKELFGRLVALFGLIKHDNQRWVFSTTIGHFCEALLYFVANAEPATVASLGITKQHFAGEVFPAYQIMFDQWLQKNEPALRLAIIQATGFMAETMEREQFDAQLPKIITGILAAYKKDKIHLPITQALSNVLDVAVADGSRVLDPLLPVVMQTLHSLVCAGPDASVALTSTMKNSNELLRCFEILSKTFSDHVIAFLMQRFESKEERVRIATLSIIKHVINTSDGPLADKKETIVSGLKVVLSDPSYKVRKAFAQVVITLGSRDYLKLEGGYFHVEFIIRQCSITRDEDEKFAKLGKKDADTVTPKELRTMCDNILSMLTTTISCMEDVLWPYLLELVVPVQYTEAVGVVCKSLAHLAAKKREAEEENYMIDYDKLVNLPKPPAILSRVLVILSRPFERPQLGENILAFIKAMGPVLHPAVAERWDDVIPKLTNYLKDKTDSPEKWVQAKWEELIVKFLVKTIEDVNDDEWTVGLCEEMTKQFPLYQGAPLLKSMLFKFVGVVLQQCSKKSVVREKLDFLFANVDHNVTEDREGCAAGYGYCASAHLDLVLDKMTAVVNNDMKKKSGGFLGLMSDKSDKDIDMIKCTAFLCYGYSAAKADVSLIKSRMDVHILSNVIPFLASSRPAIVKEAGIRCVDLLGKTMHPDHLGSEYVCTKRKDLVQAMIKFATTTVKGEVSTEVLAGSVRTAATLAWLPPALPVDEEADLLTKLGAVVIKSPASEEDNVTAMLQSMDQIFEAILDKECKITALERLLKYFMPYIRDPDGVKRRRAVTVMDNLLERYVDMEAQKEEKLREKSTENVELMKWVAALAPRCTDPVEATRSTTIALIARIMALKGMLARVSDNLPEKLNIIKERIVEGDTNQQFTVISDLSKSLAPELTATELYPFIQVLIEGLADKEPSSSSGVCIMLNGVLRLRGGELSLQVPEIVQTLHAAMKTITNEQTLNGTLHSLRTLTAHHLVLVADHILTFPLPHDEFVVKILATLSKDAKLSPLLLKNYTDLLASSQPYTEKPKTKTTFTKEGVKATMAVTCALGEMFAVTELEDHVRTVLPLLFGLLILRIGSTNGIEKSNAEGRDINADAVATFKSFLKLIKDEELLAFLDKDDNAVALGKEDFHDVLRGLTKVLMSEYPEQIKDIVAFLTPYSSRNFESQRVTVVAIFAEMIDHCKETPELLQSLLNTLLVRLADTNQSVRLLLLLGFGNLASNGPEEVNRYSTTILSALMSGMEDVNGKPELVMAAMDGLARVLGIVDATNVMSILVNICMKLKLYFETPNDKLRAHAIRLFGALSRFGEGPCKAMLYDQIQANLVSLILHLNDTDAEVKKATKITLKQFGPLLRADEINDLLQTLADDRNVIYGEFLHALTKRIIQYYSNQVNGYLMDAVNFFRSTWSQTRANAAMFIGFLLGQLPKETRRTVNVDHVCSALTLLIKDEDATVRIKCSEAMSMLYDY